jgi:hypothetical protein
MMVLHALGEIFLSSSFLPEIELQPAQPNTKNMKEWLIGGKGQQNRQG